MSESEQSVNKTESGYFCVEDVFHSSKPLHQTIGDIFVTNKGLYFISYCEFEGSLVGLGALLGGLTGALVARDRRKNQIEAALRTAVNKRNEQIGMNMNDRLTQHPGSIFFPRENIEKIESGNGNGKKILVQSGEQISEFITAESDYFKIDFHDYMTGKSAPCGIHGLDITFLGPSEFLKLIIHGEGGSAPTLLDAMSKNPKYLFNIFVAFTTLQNTEKKSVCQILSGRGSFSLDLAAIIKSDIKPQAQKAFFGALGWSLGAVFFFLLLIFGLLSVIGIDIFSDTGNSGLSLGGIIMAIIFGVTDLGFFYFAIEKFRKASNYLKHSRIFLQELEKT